MQEKISPREIERMTNEADKMLKGKTFTIDDLNKAIGQVLEMNKQMGKLLATMMPDKKKQAMEIVEAGNEDAKKILLLTKRELARNLEKGI